MGCCGGCSGCGSETAKEIRVELFHGGGSEGEKAGKIIRDAAGVARGFLCVPGLEITIEEYEEVSGSEKPYAVIGKKRVLLDEAEGKTAEQLKKDAVRAILEEVFSQDTDEGEVVYAQEEQEDGE